MSSVKYLAKYLFSCFRLFIIVGLLVVAGCAALNPVESDKSASNNRAEAVVAQDFVNIMLQIEKLNPVSTVLSFGLEEGNSSEIDARSIKTNNSFGKALRSIAANSGYTLETVDNPTSANNYVSFAIAEFGDAVDGTTYTYDVSIGEIDLRRVYKSLEDGGIEPLKAMLVRGTDVSQLEADDSIFANLSSSKASLAQTSTASPAAVAKTDQQPNQPSDDTSGSIADSTNIADSTSIADSTNIADSTSIADSTNIADSTSIADIATSESTSDEQSNVSILERPVTVAAPFISDLPEADFEGPTQESGTVAQSLAGGDLATGFETIRKINIAVTGESNYESLLADKQDVAEEILVFGDDSYVLGVRNKEILSEMMAKFNPDTDVVSVVGCSTGVTKIANGNAALAIGRANRVKEALLYSGIQHDKIYEEGCWSPQANSTPFPNRGVVVTVKRNAAGNG